MKRIINLCVCLIGIAGLFTSCINQVEPEGLQTLRQGKAAYYQALAALQTANADKAKAEAAYTTAMAAADAAYREAEASLVSAQAEYWKAQAALVAAQTKAQDEATRHAAEINKLNEQVAAAEAAYQIAFLKDQEAYETKELEVALQELENELANLKAQAEEDAIANAAAVEKAKADKEAAAVNSAAALAKAKQSLADAQKNQAIAEENLRIVLADIEAQKAVLTTNQQNLLDKTMASYKNAADAYNNSQLRLLEEKSKLVDLTDTYEDAIKKLVNDRAAIIALNNSNIGIQKSNIEDYNAEITALNAAKDANELFNGLPVEEWVANIQKLNDQMTALESHIGSLEVQLTDAKYQAMAPYLDYVKAQDEGAINIAGMAFGGDFHFDHDTLALFLEFRDYMTDQTVNKAEKTASGVVNEAADDTLTTHTALAKAINDTTYAGKGVQNAQVAVGKAQKAYDKAKAEYDNYDEAAAIAAAKKAATDKYATSETPLGMKSLNFEDYFGEYTWATGVDGVYHNGEDVVAKYMAIMEDSRTANEYVASTNNLLYTMKYGDDDVKKPEYTPGEYPYVLSFFPTHTFNVNTTPNRIQWVFNGGTIKGETVTRGILGVLDYIKETDAYDGVKTTNDDIKKALDKYGKIAHLDSLKYATNLKDAEAAVVADSTAMKASMTKLRGKSDAVNFADRWDAAINKNYPTSLVGKLESARYGWSMAFADSVNAEAALAAAKANIAAEVKTVYTDWLATGWDGKFTSKWNTGNIDGGDNAAPVDGSVEYYAKMGGLWTSDLDATRKYFTNLKTSTMLYTGKNDYEGNHDVKIGVDGDGKDIIVKGYIREVGRSPLAWREYAKYIKNQKTACVKKVVGDPVANSDAAIALLKAATKPSIFSVPTVTGTAPTCVASFEVPADLEAVANAWVAECLTTNGKGAQLASADSAFLADKLVPWIKNVKYDLTGLEKALADAKDSLVVKKKGLNDAIDAVNAECVIFNKAADAYDALTNNNIKGTTYKVMIDDAAPAKPYTTYLTTMCSEKLVIRTRANYATFDFAFETPMPADIAAIDAAYDNVGDAEMYYICLNNQTGNIVDQLLTIGDVEGGKYDNANKYDMAVNSTNIGFEYFKGDVTTGYTLRNRGYDKDYPYLLADNREHGLQLQDYNADFTVRRPDEGRYIELDGVFKDAVYYKYLYDLQVLKSLSYDFSNWKEALEKFRADVDKMYAAFQADSTEGSNAAAAAATYTSKQDKKDIMDAKKTDLDAAKAALAQVVAYYGTPADEASNKDGASMFAKYNYAVAAHAAALKVYNDAAAAYAAVIVDVKKATGDIIAKWKELVKPLYDLAIADMKEADRITELITIYEHSYQVATSAANGHPFEYPVWDGSDGEATDNADGIVDFVNGINKYYTDAIKWYNAKIDDSNDLIAAYQSIIDKTQADIDEDASDDLLEGYYDANQIAIKNQQNVVDKWTTQVGIDEYYYNYWKSTLDAVLSKLGLSAKAE